MAQANIGYDNSWNTPANPTQGASDTFAEQLAALYARLGRGAPTQAEIDGNRGNPGGLAAIEQQLIKDNAAGAPPKPADTTVTPPPTGGQPPPAGTGTSGILPPGAPGFNDFFNKPFVPPAPVNLGGPAGIPYIPPTPNAGQAPTPNLPTYEKPPAFNYQDFTPGQFSYQDFKAPSAEEALNDPGYQFRVNQGRDALERSAAAKGVLNTGGTLKDVNDYGQGAASQEYQNVWNRDFNAYGANRSNAFGNFALNEANRFGAYSANRAGAVGQYNTNYQTQYQDPYKAQYQAATDTYNPTLQSWQTGVDLSKLGYQTQAAAGQHQNDMSYQNDWNLYNFDYTKQRNYQSDVWNRLFQASTA